MNGSFYILTDRMSRYRQNKSIEELERKAKKARRKKISIIILRFEYNVFV